MESFVIRGHFSGVPPKQFRHSTYSSIPGKGFAVKLQFATSSLLRYAVRLARSIGNRLLNSLLAISMLTPGALDAAMPQNAGESTPTPTAAFSLTPTLPGTNTPSPTPEPPVTFTPTPTIAVANTPTQTPIATYTLTSTPPFAPSPTASPHARLWLGANGRYRGAFIGKKVDVMPGANLWLKSAFGGSP